MREQATTSGHYLHQYARASLPHRHESRGRPPADFRATDDQRLAPVVQSDTGCHGVWLISPTTGQVVLSAAARSIWCCTKCELTLPELLELVHQQDRVRVSAAFNDCRALHGAELELRLNSEGRSRLIWTYFSRVSSDRNAVRAWCVDVTHLPG